MRGRQIQASIHTKRAYRIILAPSGSGRPRLSAPLGSGRSRITPEGGVDILHEEQHAIYTLVYSIVS